MPCSCCVTHLGSELFWATTVKGAWPPPRPAGGRLCSKGHGYSTPSPLPSPSPRSQREPQGRRPHLNSSPSGRTTESKSQRSRGPHLDQMGPGRWLSRRGWEVIFSGRKQMSAHFLLTREGQCFVSWGRAWGLRERRLKICFLVPCFPGTPGTGRWETEG